VWISASWQYNLSTPLVVGGDEAFRGLTVMTPTWLPSRLVEGATPWPELGWRYSPPLGLSLSAARAAVTCAAGPRQLLACR
jgi:hypothetical protein